MKKIINKIKKLFNKLMYSLAKKGCGKCKKCKKQI